MKKNKPQTKGPWIHRFAIMFFAIVLTVLIFWLLGFIVDDIGAIEGPEYKIIEKKHVDQTLIEKRKSLEKKIAEVTRQIDEQKSKQKIIADSTRSLQETIGQLLELQKMSIQKNIPIPEAEQKTFADSLNWFLENQKRYQTISQSIMTLAEEKNSLQAEKRSVETTLGDQREPAQEEFRKVRRGHDLKLAFFQLLVLIPILIAAAVLIVKKRSSIYFPIFLAFGISTLLRVGFVIHQHFPSWFFKYVLILVSLLAVLKLLSYFIRTIAFPKKQWLLKQYREAYEHFLCPICEYPIKRGPMKFLFWNRRTIKNIRLPKDFCEDGSDYVCPACGTTLFEECVSCHKIRHSLLPYCEHCGEKKEIEEVKRNA